MRYLLLLLILPALLASLLITKDKDPISVTDLKNSQALACGSAFNITDIDTLANGKYIVALPGWGNYSYKISTGNDSTRFYFNQGLSMYYSYHMKESNASFKEAARFDPACAMAYWGQALAMGPYYNFAAGYKMNPSVLTVLQQMNHDSMGTTDKEKELIAVMNLRYAADIADTKRTALNKAYAMGMKRAITLYPDDADIKMLYIDAIMLIHPWDFWNNDGSPKEWTPEVVSLCEAVLKKNPEHPAALHYYIHLTEASRHPEVALASADKLKDLLPGVAHMVHMSSHEYERNGLFVKGVEVNDVADDDLLRYDSLAGNVQLSRHVPHYFAVQSYCAISGAMYKKSMDDALRCRRSVSPAYGETNLQNLYMMPEFAMVRMGKWEEILKDTTRPDSKWPGARAMLHFARGMAFVYTGHPDSAAKELMQLRVNAHDTILLVREIPYNLPLQRVSIAEGILQAAILFSEKKNDAGIKCLVSAIKNEDSLIYFEPKDWMIPARQFLGAYLLKMNRPAWAEKIYKEDLIWNPGNGWSLLGMYQSLKASHKDKLLRGYKSRYEMAFSQAEQIPPASVYMENHIRM